MIKKRELKAPLRNFTLEQAADNELVRLKNVTGKNMTAVLEDLILVRRQFGEQIETFLNAEQERTGRSRREIVEMALLMFFANPSVPPPRLPSSGKDLAPHHEDSSAEVSPSRRNADILESVAGL